ncbi:MAG: hypothetical protein ACM3QU_06000 [Verrucomicrobiota bacterium]
MSEPEDVGTSTGRTAGRTNTFDLLLSQPEILSWLELTEQELVTWLAPERRDDGGRATAA